MIINFKEERETNTELVKKYHSIGLYYSKIGKTKKAIEFFKKVLNINPNHLDSKNKIKVLIKRMENNEKKNNYQEPFKKKLEIYI
jgi:tetratricopeptide (TPR) repeat protein